jgi:predicted amidohydrolase
MIPENSGQEEQGMDDDGILRDHGAATLATVGRPVQVVSLGFRIGSKSLEEVAAVVNAEATRGCDLLVLPETWTGLEPERVDGPAVTALAAIARRRRTYIVCPIYRWDDAGHRWNSAIILDRQGEVACVYDKLYPYWSEFELTPPVQIGREAPVYQADFGRVGMAICFDVNFPAVWQRLAQGQAEMVLWPSAYSAGSSLQAHALNHHFVIVTATSTGDCQVFDITGERVLDERADNSEGFNISRITLDLDRGIYHENFNREKRDRLLREHGDDVLLEKCLPREEWFVLKAKRAGVSARALARQYGMEELRDYKSRSCREIDERRGSGVIGNMAAATAPSSHGSRPQ